TKYMVLKQGKQADEANNKYINRNLIVMRPYQITAVEEALRRLNCWNQPKPLFDKGGYIWHSTGSGKTLTSFKLSTLIANDSRFKNIDKIIFCVDRQDLDFQTRKEFDKFQKGSIQDSKNTKDLITKLESNKSNDRIVITTIQKLARVVKDSHNFKDKKFVFIFDECHRSQFGETHSLIKKYFKDNLMFGFTGTPIIADKEIDDSTERLFGDCLHSYKINDAIKASNVLGFHIQYIKGSGFSGIQDTIEDNEKIDDNTSVDFQRPYSDPRRIANNVELIINNLPKYTIHGKFNAMFAVHSKERLKQYYDEFKKQNPNLKIGAIYSTTSAENNNLLTGNIDDENNEDVSGLSSNDRDYLENVIIKDFNEMYGDSCSASYFKEYSQKLQSKINEDDKEKRLDLVIVVNMFLTGFDAPRLNTLIIDKKLKKHGLIQAISRTNRLFNETKTQGNVLVMDVSFGKEMEKAFDLYTSDTTYIFTRNFNDYYELGYDDKKGKHHKSYIEFVGDLVNNFNLANTNFIELEINAKIDFINTFNQFAKLRHFLKQFAEFTEEKELINGFQYTQYVSHCQAVRAELWKNIEEKNGEIYDISNDLTYHSEIYLTEIYDVNKIIGNLNDTVQNKELTEDKMCEFKIRIEATNESLNKKKLLLAFLERANGNINDGDIVSSMESYALQSLNHDVEKLVRSHDVVEHEIREYIKHSLKTRNLSFAGSTIVNLIKTPLNRFGSANSDDKVESLKRDLKDIYETYYGDIIDYDEI
ncbi:MAG: type I restriction endonuclease subunit R, EcoR124 family, partial [Mycoplasma sp.]